LPIVLSLFLPYLLGLGLFLMPLFPALFEDIPRLTRQEKAGLLALLLVFGVLTDYLLVLVMANIKAALVVGSLLSLAGLVHGLFRLRGKLLQLFNLGWIPWMLVLYLILVYAVPIVLDPVSAWDARSIWFFHGKMIYYNQALSWATGLDKVPERFSHVDYPKLLPVLAGQFAAVAGYWNESLPKGSLLALLVPALLGIFSFFRGVQISFFYLIALFLFGPGEFLWNGYMDGYLALYAGLSLLFWGRWLSGGKIGDLVAGTLLLGGVINLKNEGILFVLALVIALVAMRLLGRDSVKFAFPWRFWTIAAVPGGCFLLWSLKKAAWGLENNLRLGSGSLPLIHEHVGQGAIRLIGKWLMVDGLVGKAAIIFLAALTIARCLRVRLPVSVWFAATTALIYFAGIFCVYLATPADLNWHLSSSASRTMMTVLTALFAATFFTLQELETASDIKESASRAESRPENPAAEKRRIADQLRDL
jgi:hypothetical protein